MSNPYSGLPGITDPVTRQVVKVLMDRLGTLEAQAGTIGSVTKPLTDPLHAGSQQIKALADPTDATDAVTLQYLHRYVESRVKTSVAAAVNTIPGTPGGPPPTPAPPPTPPPTTPPGTPGAGVLTRGFNLAGTTILNSPTDIASWAVTGSISSVSIIGNDTRVECNKISPANSSPPPAAGLWPAPAAFPIQYTIWILLQIGGVWYASGFIEMWVGRPATATPIGANWLNYAYDGRWGPMTGYVPTPGSIMGFFLSAGSARGHSDVYSVRERSEVVQLVLPDANGAIFS